MRNEKFFMILSGLLFSSTVLAQQVHIESDILGLCDTGNKTTLKKDLIYTHGPGDINLYHYDFNGKRVVYNDEKKLCIPLAPVHYTGHALISIGNVNDKLVDASNARIRLVDGNTYYADEFILKADKLTGKWKNGYCVYTLNDGDLEFNTWGYDTSADYNSGREWSIMGGDGSGVYAFTFEVSGLRYDGKELPAATFPVNVYCYGRSCTDMAGKSSFVENTYNASYNSGLKPGKQTQWKWYTGGKQSAADKPYMNDAYTDYFTVVWPKGTDASSITAKDVSATLTSRFGDTLRLSTTSKYGEHEYAVVSDKSETTICVLYQQGTDVPAYNKLTLEVNNGSLSATKTYDVASAGVMMAQTGGGGVGVDHTLVCFNYHGLGNMNIDNALNKYYTLSTVVDGETYFYAEDAKGKGYLTKGIKPTGNIQHGPFSKPMPPKDAWKGDGTEIYHLAVHGNVVFTQDRLDTPDSEVTTEVKEVNGKQIKFKREFRASIRVEEMIARGCTLDPGFNTIGHPRAAWEKRYSSGWTTASPRPATLPYNPHVLPYGYKQSK